MQSELDKKIEAVRRIPAPSVPANLETNVLRRVRILNSTTSNDTIVDWLSGLVPNTNFVLSAIALAVAVSALATAATTMAMTTDRKATLNQALGFDTITMTNVIDLQKH